MVGTLEGERLARLAEAAVGQPVATVLADVVYAADAAVLLSHENDRLATDLADDEIARLGHVQLTPTQQPHLSPHALPFQAHEIRASIATRIDQVGAELR